MKKKYKLLIMLTIFLQGCGTIVLDAHSPIGIEGNAEDKTQYFIYNMDNKLIASGYAPNQVNFESSYKNQDAEYKVLLQPTNKEAELYKIKRGVAIWPFLYPVTIPVDLITDSFRVFPDVELSD